MKPIKVTPVIYRNRHHPLETVKITSITETMMMGMNGNERVKTVMYEKITDIFGSRRKSELETTWDNFNEKYVTIAEDREEKINKILNDSENKSR